MSIEPPDMQLRYVVHQADMRETQRIAATLCRPLLRGVWGLLLVNMVVWMFIGIAVMATFRSLERNPNWVRSPLFIVVVCLALAWIGHVAFLKLSARRVRTALINAFRPYPIEQVVTVSDQGLTFDSRWGSSRYFWTAIQETRELPAHVALVVRPLSVIAIPNHAFPSLDAKREFISIVQGRIGT